MGVLVPHGILSQLRFILSERLNAESTALRRGASGELRGGKEKAVA